MKITDKQLDEFIEIHRKKHGVTLDRQDAYDQATRLLRMVELVESNAQKMGFPGYR